MNISLPTQDIQIKTGEIWTHDCFYRNSQDICKRKHILILYAHDNEIIFRVLTSKQKLKQQQLGCYNDRYETSFYLDDLNGQLPKKTWVVLGAAETNQVYDELEFKDFINSFGFTKYQEQIDKDLLYQIIRCCISSDDTTRHEMRLLQDFINKVNDTSILDTHY